MSGIFKAYDIRGVYPDELDESLARDIGLATGEFLDQGSIVVGHDMREVAEPISAALVDGLRDSGQDVIDIGLCSTPMNYNAIGHFDGSGGVMVTASHNPPEYIGFKISREQAKPVSYESGIGDIEDSVRSGVTGHSNERGSYRSEDFLELYVRNLAERTDTIQSLSVALDTGNGMGGLTVPRVFDRIRITYEGLYLDLDGNFPNHTPNPVVEDNLRDLKRLMGKDNYDLGVAFDGDADRAVFLDENGRTVPADLVTALLARRYLEDHPNASIIYDLRSSRIVPETIRNHGGNPVRYRVGHAYIKEKMREVDAVFGGELSGHYYFRKNYYTDCGLIATLDLLCLLAGSSKPLSELVEPLRKYAQSGEVNFEVDDQDAAITALEETFSDGEVDHLDGVTVRYDNWWFNVRPSNTEPLLRLNLEAESEDLMERKVDDVSNIIQDYE